MAAYILEFNGTMLLVIDNISIDSETPRMTTSISRFVGSTRFFGGVYRSRVYTQAMFSFTQKPKIF